MLSFINYQSTSFTDEIIEKADRLMYFVKNNGKKFEHRTAESIYQTFDQQASKPTALAANRHTAVILVANRFFQISRTMG